jgi:hypothetical protein
MGTPFDIYAVKASDEGVFALVGYHIAIQLPSAH